MKLLRLFLLALMLVSSLPAVPACCEAEPVATDCCGDQSECPTLPTGECALAAAVAPPAAPVTPVVMDATQVGVFVFNAPPRFAATAAALRPPASAVPRAFTRQVLRI